MRSLHGLRPYLLSALAITAFLLFWHCLSATGLLGRYPGAVMSVLLPSPLEVLRTFGEMLSQGQLWDHTATSLRRVAVGFSLALLVGVPTGLLMAFSSVAEGLARPLIRLVQPIPGVAWVPLAIIWFGLGDRAAYFIIAVGALFPLLLATFQGAREVDPVLVESTMTLGAQWHQVFLKVTLPSMVPHLVTGSQLAMGFAWRVVLAAEMVGVTSGLGYMLTLGRGVGRTDITLLTMAVIGLLMTAMDSLVFTPLSARTSKWRPKKS